MALTNDTRALYERARTETITAAELQLLTTAACNDHDFWRRGDGPELIGVLRRHRDTEIEGMRTLSSRAERENRGLLASEQREFDHRKKAAEDIGVLMRTVDEEERDTWRIPESQRWNIPDPPMMPGRAAERRETGVSLGFLPAMTEYRAARAMGGSSGPGGGYLVPEQAADRFFDRLRPASVVLAAGPVILPMTRDTLPVPLIGSSATAAFYAENQEITASDLGFKACVLTARKLAALCRASNEVFADSSPALREVLAYDLIRTMASTLDDQMLEGSGAGSNLLGIRHTPSATVTELGTGNGTSPTLTNVLDAIGRLEQDNARASAIFLHPRTWNTLKRLLSGDGRYLLTPDPSSGAPRSLFGVPVHVSSQISITETVGASSDCSWIAVCDMRQIVVGHRADVEIVYDASRYFEYDQTAVRVISRWDLGCLNAEGVELITGVRP